MSNWQQFLYNNSDHTLVISSNNVNGTVSWTPSNDTWYHLAVVRNGTAFRWYVNGTQVGSDITYADAMVNITGLLTVGYDTSTANRELDGYID